VWRRPPDPNSSFWSGRVVLVAWFAVLDAETITKVFRCEREGQCSTRGTRRSPLACLGIFRAASVARVFLGKVLAALDDPSQGGLSFAGRTVAFAALVSLALMVAGCGGGGGSPGSQVARLTTSGRQSSTPSRGSTHDQAVAYAACVRSHGVPLWPDPENSGAFDKSKLTPQQLGVSTLRIGTAEKACKRLLPTYSTSQQSHVLTQALRFSRCMRAHGAPNFPDPESNGAIVIPHAIENSQAYLAALHFCIHKYGVPPPPSPGG
jgi:hypothetical protein